MRGRKRKNNNNTIADENVTVKESKTPSSNQENECKQERVVPVFTSRNKRRKVEEKISTDVRSCTETRNSKPKRSTLEEKPEYFKTDVGGICEDAAVEEGKNRDRGVQGANKSVEIRAEVLTNTTSFIKSEEHVNETTVKDDDEESIEKEKITQIFNIDPQRILDKEDVLHGITPSCNVDVDGRIDNEEITSAVNVNGEPYIENKEKAPLVNVDCEGSTEKEEIIQFVNKDRKGGLEDEEIVSSITLIVNKGGDGSKESEEIAPFVKEEGKGSEEKVEIPSILKDDRERRIDNVEILQNISPIVNKDDDHNIEGADISQDIRRMVNKTSGRNIDNEDTLYNETQNLDGKGDEYTLDNVTQNLGKKGVPDTFNNVTQILEEKGDVDDEMSNIEEEEEEEEEEDGEGGGGRGGGATLANIPPDIEEEETLKNITPDDPDIPRQENQEIPTGNITEFTKPAVLIPEDVSGSSVEPGAWMEDTTLEGQDQDGVPVISTRVPEVVPESVQEPEVPLEHALRTSLPDRTTMADESLTKIADVLPGNTGGSGSERNHKDLGIEHVSEIKKILEKGHLKTKIEYNKLKLKVTNKKISEMVTDAAGHNTTKSGSQKLDNSTPIAGEKLLEIGNVTETPIDVPNNCTELESYAPKEFIINGPRDLTKDSPVQLEINVPQEFAREASTDGRKDSTDDTLTESAIGGPKELARFGGKELETDGPRKDVLRNDSLEKSELSGNINGTELKKGASGELQNLSINTDEEINGRTPKELGNFTSVGRTTAPVLGVASPQESEKLIFASTITGAELNQSSPGILDKNVKTSAEERFNKTKLDTLTETKESFPNKFMVPMDISEPAGLLVEQTDKESPIGSEAGMSTIQESSVSFHQNIADEDVHLAPTQCFTISLSQDSIDNSPLCLDLNRAAGDSGDKSTTISVGEVVIGQENCTSRAKSPQNEPEKHIQNEKVNSNTPRSNVSPKKEDKNLPEEKIKYPHGYLGDASKEYFHHDAPVSYLNDISDNKPENIKSHPPLDKVITTQPRPSSVNNFMDRTRSTLPDIGADSKPAETADIGADSKLASADDASANSKLTNIAGAGAGADSKPANIANDIGSDASAADSKPVNAAGFNADGADSKQANAFTDTDAGTDSKQTNSADVVIDGGASTDATVDNESLGLGMEEDFDISDSQLCAVDLGSQILSCQPSGEDKNLYEKRSKKESESKEEGRTLISGFIKDISGLNNMILQTKNEIEAMRRRKHRHWYI